MRSTTRLAAVTAAAAAVLVGSATTATAQSTTIDDRRYDVLIADSGTLASKGTYAQRVASSNIDIDTMTVNHGKNFVSIRVNLHKLGAQGSNFVNGGVKANSGASDDFYFFAGPDGEGGIQASSGPGEGSSSSTTCNSDPGTSRITGTSKVGTGGFVQIYVPRTCFDNPTSIRVGSAGIFSDTQQNLDVSKPGVAAAALAEPTDETYIDLVHSVYVGAPQYTKTLARN